jgi:uncharacterized RDD family membrane protein YckC
VLHSTLSELAWGRTVGKAMVGGRVIALSGGPPRPKQVLVRNLFKALALAVPPLALLVLLNPNRQRLGDLVAGTVVVADEPDADAE